MHKNDILEQLISFGVCNRSSIETFFPRVRDRNDIAVLRCNQSGVIFLSRTDHINQTHYKEQKGHSYWSSEDRRHAINADIEDTHRRKKLLQNIVVNKTWLDIGTGTGGILDELSNYTLKTYAIEPQDDARKSLEKLGYDIFSNIESFSKIADVVTLFHVFEHLVDPLEDLKSIYNKMSSGGKIIIEVPHAKDFLIKFIDHESFKRFTFWSEHLILHTRESLTTFLRESGFVEIVVTGCQRYPLANHLHWLKKDKPRGHLHWNFLRSDDLDRAYSDMLKSIDMNDTIIATAVKS